MHVLLLIHPISLKAYDLNGIGPKSIVPKKTLLDTKKSAEKDPTPESGKREGYTGRETRETVLLCTYF